MGNYTPSNQPRHSSSASSNVNTSKKDHTQNHHHHRRNRSNSFSHGSPPTDGGDTSNTLPESKVSGPSDGHSNQMSPSKIRLAGKLSYHIAKTHPTTKETGTASPALSSDSKPSLPRPSFSESPQKNKQKSSRHSHTHLSPSISASQSHSIHSKNSRRHSSFALTTGSMVNLRRNRRNHHGHSKSTMRIQFSQSKKKKRTKRKKDENNSVHSLKAISSLSSDRQSPFLKSPHSRHHTHSQARASFSGHGGGIRLKTKTNNRPKRMSLTPTPQTKTGFGERYPSTKEILSALAVSEMSMDDLKSKEPSLFSHWDLVSYVMRASSSETNKQKKVKKKSVRKKHKKKDRRESVSISVSLSNSLQNQSSLSHSSQHQPRRRHSVSGLQKPVQSNKIGPEQLDLSTVLHTPSSSQSPPKIGPHLSVQTISGHLPPKQMAPRLQWKSLSEGGRSESTGKDDD